MAKRRQAPPTDPMVITQEDIQKSYKDFYEFSACPVSAVPVPTRSFAVGEEVRLGGLKNSFVAEILEGGKAYRLEYDRSEKNPAAGRQTRCWWWFDVQPLNTTPKTGSLFAGRLPGQVNTTSLDSLLMMMDHGGLVCDPRFQRSYVWTLTDQEMLIDSIFNWMNIGSFIFARHHGYLHKESNDFRVYKNLDGESFNILRKNDYTNSIVDGQQRLTTLWRFYTNQFKYRGFYFNELAYKDRFDFESLSVSIRIFDEDDVDYADILRMFIRTNQGVPQDPSHLEKVRQQLAQLVQETHELEA